MYSSRFRAASWLSRTRPLSSHRYHVATVTGVPSGRTAPITAGFGRLSTSTNSLGIGGFGMLRRYLAAVRQGAASRRQHWPK
jgi:hypothetical protein